MMHQMQHIDKVRALPTAFHVLARTMAPALSPEDLARLDSFYSAPDCPWEALLSLANRHKVTPLWYLQLQRHDLLPSAPEELRLHLKILYVANLDRCRAFLKALQDLVVAFGGWNDPLLALKGGAALADNLYGDPGARIMGDLDLLVPREALDQVPEVMTELGYAWDREVETYWRANPEAAFKHFPRCHLPGTPVAVEIHYRVLSREGDYLDAANFLERGMAVAGHPGLLVAAPTDRLLHNALHALTSERAWLKSRLGLRDLVEFAWLWQRDREQIRIDSEQVVALGGMAKQLRVYAVLAADLFALDLPTVLRQGVSRHQRRRFDDAFAGRLSPLRQQGNALLRYPLWLLRNNRMAVAGIPRRKMLGYLLRRLFQRQTWKTVREHWDE